MTHEDLALGFDCAGERLLGILTLPSSPCSTAVVMVVGGPQYRAGSHRQYRQLAQALGARGFAVLRFDHRGMGDSTGAMRHFESVSADIAAAIDALQVQLPGCRQVVLFGLCDGASAALLYLDRTADARVRGLCLLNPWLRSEQTQAKTRLKHYYLQRLASPDFWRKLAAGGVGLTRLREFAAALRQSLAPQQVGGAAADAGQNPAGSVAQPDLPYPQAMARAWTSFNGPVLLALSDNDYTAHEFLEFARGDPSWRGLLEQPRVQRLALPQSDHTLSSPAGRALLAMTMTDWLADGLP